jgi:two-component system phosphate regulon sensor histidine kinase PhoR
MKRIFPLIVVLITLSVVGILLIQMSWINKALQLKHDEFQREVDNSLKQSAEAIQDQFLSKQETTPIGKNTRQYILDNKFTTQGFFTTEDLHSIIEAVLKKNNIKQPFEFCVLNIFRNPVFNSEGFHPQDLTSMSTFSIGLANDNNAMQQEELYITIHEDKGIIIREMSWMIIVSIVFTTIIIMAFVLTVRTLFNQKKLSEIKSDFINNMTHELKTPLATISLAIDALTNEKVIHDTDKIKIYSSMIKEENKRMNKQVEKILQAARLEKEEIKLNVQQLDTHQIINKVADNMILQIQEKNGTLRLNLTATNHIIEADEVHFSNIIFNLLDNATKYSQDAPHIELSTLNTGNGMLSIKVKDNGIGMDKETITRIFEKFYRAHTGNLHNVKGFGLGLSYVKAIVDAHNGKIKVESVLGKGSTFTIILPTYEEGKDSTK